MRKAFHSMLVALLFLLSVISLAKGQQQPCQTSIAYGQNAV